MVVEKYGRPVGLLIAVEKLFMTTYMRVNYVVRPTKKKNYVRVFTRWGSIDKGTRMYI